MLEPRDLPLLDTVTVVHGPTRDLGKYFLQADAEARRAGVSLQMRCDFDGLVAVGLANEDTWKSFPPTFHPVHSDLLPDRSYWLSAQDDAGQIVATCAARLMRLGSRTLTPEFTSLRCFYDRCDGLGVTCTVEGPALTACERITGRLSFTGAQWTHPSFRGRGIVHLLSRLNRFLALTMWNTDFSAAVTKADLKAKGAITPYGYASDLGIHLHDLDGSTHTMSLIWTDRLGMEMDLRLQTMATRVTEVQVTARSPLTAQGSNSLS